MSEPRRPLRRNVAMLARLIWRVEPRTASAGFVAHMLAGLANPLAALLLGLLVDATIARDGTRMTVLALALALAWVASIASANFGNWLVNGLQERMAIYVERDLIRLTTGIPDVEHHERDEHLDQLALLREQRHRFSLVAFTLADLVAIAVQLLGSAIALASVELPLLLLPAFAIPNMLLTARAERLVHDARDRTGSGVRLANHLYEVATTPAAGKDMRLSGMAREIQRRHRAVWDDVTAERAAAQLRAAGWRSIGVALFGLGYGACVVYALARAASGDASVGEVVLVLAIAAQLSSGLASGVDVVSWFAQALRSFDRYAWLADRHASATRDGGPAEAPPAALRDGLELRGVGFRYPGAARPALHGLDLRIPPGTLVALVGENGSGKSTLVKLLCRLYTPSEGEIALDGTPLERLAVAPWRGRIAAVFQDFARFELSAREVVGVGDAARMDDEAAIAGALARAQADTLVAGLPRGLDTPLGNRHGDGMDLSGGQWQRLALARAMMRDAPLLLVLDEPASALDAHAEDALLETYAAEARSARAATGAITLFVSHRLSTARMADLIVVLRGGAIEAVGTHAELIERPGTYRELYELQRAAYAEGPPAG